MNGPCRWERGWCGYGGYETRTQRARRRRRGTRGGQILAWDSTHADAYPYNVSRPPSGCGKAHTLRRRRRRAFPSLGPRDQDLVLTSRNGDENESEGGGMTAGAPSSAPSLNPSSMVSTRTHTHMDTVHKRRWTAGGWEGGRRGSSLRLRSGSGDRKQMGKRMVNTKRGNSRTRKNESRDGNGK